MRSRQGGAHRCTCCVLHHAAPILQCCVCHHALNWPAAIGEECAVELCALPAHCVQRSGQDEAGRLPRRSPRPLHGAAQQATVRSPWGRGELPTNHISCAAAGVAAAAAAPIVFPGMHRAAHAALLLCMTQGRQGLAAAGLPARARRLALCGSGSRGAGVAAGCWRAAVRTQAAARPAA